MRGGIMLLWFLLTALSLLYVVIDMRVGTTRHAAHKQRLENIPSETEAQSVLQRNICALGRWNKLAFKRGACLRKMYIGSQGRFSTDLDFTGVGEHDHEDVILEMMQASDQPFHGI